MSLWKNTYQDKSRSFSSEIFNIPIDDNDDACVKLSASNESDREASTIAYEYLYSQLGDLAIHVFKFLELNPPKPKRIIMSVNHTAAESLRYDVSPAAAPAIASGFLEDLIEEGHLNMNI